MPPPMSVVALSVLQMAIMSSSLHTSGSVDPRTPGSFPFPFQFVVHHVLLFLN